MSLTFIKAAEFTCSLRQTFLSAAIALCAAFSAPFAAPAHAQELWEYSPYKLRVWLAIDAAPEFTPGFERQLRQTILDRADTDAGATWNATVAPIHAKLRTDALERIGQLTFADVSGIDLVIITRRSVSEDDVKPQDNEASPSSPSTSSNETSPDNDANNDGAGEEQHPPKTPPLPPPPDISEFSDLAKSGIKVGLVDPQASVLGAEIKRALEKAKLWDRIQDNVKVKSTGGRALVEQVADGSIDVAIVYKAFVAGQSDRFNIIPFEEGTRSQLILDDDKVLVLAVGRANDSYRVRAREFDCRTQTWSATFERKTGQLDQLPAYAFDALTAAFRPLGRIEKVRGKHIEVRLRAGGLFYGGTYIGVDGDYNANVAQITSVDPDSPAARAVLQPGDVITKLDGEKVPQFSEFLSRLSEQSPGDVVELEISRNGETATHTLMLAGHSPSWIGGDAVLQPVIRRSDRYGNLRPDGIEVVQWTLLTVESQRRSNYACVIQSAMRAPIGERTSRRTEKYALAVKAAGIDTTLILESADEPGTPLAGYQIYSRSPTAENSDLLGRTDWRGRILIPPSEHPLRVLYVKSGQRLLARLPMIPGLEQEQKVELSSDDQRLAAEAVLRGLQNRFLDLIARQQVMAARVRLQIEQGEYREAEALIEEMRHMETRGDFETLLRDEKQLLATEDKRMQAKIDALFSDIQRLLPKHLDPALPNTLDRELKQARGGNAAARAN